MFRSMAEVSGAVPAALYRVAGMGAESAVAVVSVECGAEIRADCASDRSRPNIFSQIDRAEGVSIFGPNIAINRSDCTGARRFSVSIT